MGVGWFLKLRPKAQGRDLQLLVRTYAIPYAGWVGQRKISVPTQLPHQVACRAMPTLSTNPVIAVQLVFAGIVQGVGFRPLVRKLAQARQLSGRVFNRPGEVVVELTGPAHVLVGFERALLENMPCAAQITSRRRSEIEPDLSGRFTIAPSERTGSSRLAVPADLALCHACRAEVLDPYDRRAGHALASCTLCGPRFSVTEATPYDRSTTTMQDFELCHRCAQEYDDPEDRRNHAQSISCPECGPQVRAWSVGDDAAVHPVAVSRAVAVDFVAKALRAGKIAALKGIGGYHLACDATDDTAVVALRKGKHREAKPLAVMVEDVEAAKKIAEVSAAAQQLLESAAAPIVLLPLRCDGGLANSVVQGIDRVGVVLAYSPLHLAILQAVQRPLVMTSANLHNAPTCCDDDHALERLAGVAQVFLSHDRRIARRVDDSVVMLHGDDAVFVRRSRGYVPQPIAVSTPFACPVLACGSHTDNTFCIGVDAQAVPSAHMGDLEDLATYRDYQRSIVSLQNLLGVTPAVVAYDLHPGYLSTRYAHSLHGVQRIGVQHHHAHVAAVVAEHRLPGQVLGLCFDGTGMGDDGTGWGSEFLLADLRHSRSLAHFRAFAHPGGELAVRQPFRGALSLLADAYEGAPPQHAVALLKDTDPALIRGVQAQLRAGINAPVMRGLGRYFDAFAALILGRGRARHEAELAVALECAARERAGAAYAFAVTARTEFHGDAPEVDLRPTVRAVVDDLARGQSAHVVAGRFHQTLIDACTLLATQLLKQVGDRPIVLAGGCFLNEILTAGLQAELGPGRVFLAQQLPLGDGGLAFGQAVVAGARLHE